MSMLKYTEQVIEAAETPKELEMQALTSIALSVARICDAVERLEEMERRKNGCGVQGR